MADLRQTSHVDIPGSDDVGEEVAGGALTVGASDPLHVQVDAQRLQLVLQELPGPGRPGPLRLPVPLTELGGLRRGQRPEDLRVRRAVPTRRLRHDLQPDRKSTRLNSSHVKSSYAVFCL